MKNIDKFKKDAPGFKPIFDLIARIIDSKNANNHLLDACIQKMYENLIKNVTNKRLINFLQLPSSVNDYSIYRRSFLEEVILTGIERALKDKINTANFLINIKKDVLEEKEILLPDISLGYCYFVINEIGGEIHKYIPQILKIELFSTNINDDDLQFSIYYDSTI